MRNDGDEKGRSSEPAVVGAKLTGPKKAMWRASQPKGPFKMSIAELLRWLRDPGQASANAR